MQARVHILAISNKAERTGRELDGLAHRCDLCPLDGLDAPREGLSGVQIRPGREMDTIGGDGKTSPPST